MSCLPLAVTASESFTLVCYNWPIKTGAEQASQSQRRFVLQDRTKSRLAAYPAFSRTVTDRVFSRAY